MGCEKRLDRTFKNAPVLPFDINSKIVLFSDCHRGVGNNNDNFLKNQHIYFAALRYYYTNGFTYIELGDGDELWENRSFAAISEIHSNVFWQLSLFEKEHRLHMLYGKPRPCAEKLPPYSPPRGAGVKTMSTGRKPRRLHHKTMLSGAVFNPRTPG